MTIQTNSNINPLPILDSVDNQLHRQRWSKYVPMYIPYNKLLPFQIFTSIFYTELVINIKDLEGNTLYSITQADGGMFYINTGSNLVWTCPDNFLPTDKYLPLDKECYLEYYFPQQFVGFPSIYYYSEIAQPVERYEEDLLKLEWWNERNQAIGEYEIQAKYNNSYLPFRYYFYADLSKPSYPFEDNIQEREMREFHISIISDKEFGFTIRVTEPLMDSLRICRLADYIAITYRNKLYKVEKFEFDEIDWSEAGGDGDLRIRFTVDSIGKKLAVSKPTRGDFNDDYSDSFFNQE